ncbi:uncharacterized protein BKCO1_4700037 [Diplodia corticola]|uniref:Uncharacterized protein n=1 Tax=Diplodia corticola TaxID=236234 RepID=A0A1J9RSX2_9PEZI|nr:uncharacterized protein BKCO1_4700037 [Diplodia corticola]OJD31535.1 hypothetical protein BKCO1_4700037 [Diplodia corticola]
MGEAKFRARRSATPGTTAICSLLNRTSLHHHRSAASQTTPDHTADSSGRSMVTPPRFLCRDPHTLAAIRSLPRSGNLVLFSPAVPPEPEPQPSFGDDGGAVQSPPHTSKSGRASGDAPMDPFEPLGRALSRHHSRVRHVPYVPSVGMTGTHRTFLEHASAIVLVVVCNAEQGRSRRPPSSGKFEQPDRSTYILPPPRQSSTTPTQASFNHDALPWPHRSQHNPSSDSSFRFASQVFVAAADLGERTGPDPAIPTVLLIVGEDEAEAVRRNDQLDMLMDELEAEYDMRFRPGPQVVLVSRSYSSGALRRVAGLIAGSEE